MRRSKFVQLVSSYLDGEISPVAKAELFAEVARRPERRALLGSMCRLNSATCRAHFPAAAPIAPKHRHWSALFLWSLGGSVLGVAAALLIIAWPASRPSRPEKAPAIAVVYAKPRYGSTVVSSNVQMRGLNRAGSSYVAVDRSSNGYDDRYVGLSDPAHRERASEDIRVEIGFPSRSARHKAPDYLEGIIGDMSPPGSRVADVWQSGRELSFASLEQ